MIGDVDLSLEARTEDRGRLEAEVVRLRAELEAATRERDEARATERLAIKTMMENVTALEARLSRVRAALEGTPESIAHVARSLADCARAGGYLSVEPHQWLDEAAAILTALRERCFGVEGAAPTGDEGKEGERRDDHR